jgi:hypothetical protein
LGINTHTAFSRTTRFNMAEDGLKRLSPSSSEILFPAATLHIHGRGLENMYYSIEARDP